VSGVVIYALPVANGILGICPMPGRGGEYAGDLAHIKDWKPALVITMATEVEMVSAGAGQLGTDLRYSGARWYHLPVADYGVPTEAQKAEWRDVAEPACRALRGGGRVLIHCMGGCGRSGMAAVRLMVACGEKPDAALARLRGVRPCAVETEAQFAWARKRTFPVGHPLSQPVRD
jgi:hypothetical protein